MDEIIVNVVFGEDLRGKLSILSMSINWEIDLNSLQHANFIGHLMDSDRGEI